MKSLFKVSLLSAAVVLAVGCKEAPKAEAPAPTIATEPNASTPAPEVATESNASASVPEIGAESHIQVVTGRALFFKTEDDKGSYAVGASYGDFIKKSTEAPRKLGIDLKESLIFTGLEDEFADKAKLKPEEVKSILDELDRRIAVLVQEKAETQVATESNAQAVTDDKDGFFKTENEKAAYAIGVSIAQLIKKDTEQVKTLGINLNTPLIIKGIEHGLADKLELKPEEAEAVIDKLNNRITTLTQEKATEKAMETQKVGDVFRAEFEKQEGVTKTKSGLLYQVLTPAIGDKPKETDTVEVHYKGTLVDGTVFDSSYDRNAPAKFPLNRVIPGWTEGVQLMSVGSKYKLVLPPQIGYGSQDTASIPANSTLIFEVELLSIENKAAKSE